MQSDTKARILNVAERLFAARGLDATSLRQITRDAEVNLAAVNYHFGSKDGLIQAAFLRRVGPINQERIALLDAYEQAVDAGQAPDLEQVLGCFIRPVFRLAVDFSGDGFLFLRLIGRCYSDPGEAMRTIFLREFAPVLVRYRAAFGRALPGLNETEITWRMNFTLGMLSHTLLANPDLRAYTNGLCDPSDHEGIIRRLIAFSAAGFRAGAALPTAI